MSYNILIYFPTNSRAADIQSVAELLVKQNHKVYLLTHAPWGAIHDNCQRFGVNCFVANVSEQKGIKFYVAQIKFLSGFLKQHQINIIFSHLQACGFIAGYVARSNKNITHYYNRHNTDDHILGGSRNAKVLNKLANFFAKKIIAPSKKVQDYLIDVEKISPTRIVQISQGYNFQQYYESDHKNLASVIREQFPAKMLLITVARYTKNKRYELMFHCIEKLVAKGYDVKFICLGNGEKEEELKTIIAQAGMQQNIFLLGRKDNVFDYLEAADLFLLLSETEASNIAVKEAGICRKAVIVCQNVGDFEDYIVHNQNGFLVNKQNPTQEASDILYQLYSNQEKMTEAGNALYNTIVQNFSIEQVSGMYEALLT